MRDDEEEWEKVKRSNLKEKVKKTNSAKVTNNNSNNIDDGLMLMRCSRR